MPLKTVKVPSALEDQFASAERVVGEYFRRRRDDPERGTIEIFGERYVLVRAAALSVEFFRLVRELYGAGRELEADAFARNILFDLAHAIGKSDAQSFHAKMGLSDPIAKLSAGPVHFAHTGWAFVEIFPESRPAPDESYFIVYDHPYSFESEAWLTAEKQSGFPACIMNAGYSSGWCEESFGVQLVASEILCRAQGDEHCRFVMAHPDRIEAQILGYLRSRPELTAQSFEIPDFFARKRLEEELRKSRDELELRVERRTAELLRTNERLEREMAEREVAERRLRQAHKMEAIGRLAGGIAHDFNNLLTAIRGYSELALTSLSSDDPARNCVWEIRQASDRAADLTRRLLAFSRQQVIAPTVVDVGAAVQGLYGLLRRLIGEDVVLETNVEPKLGGVLADKSEIEQLIVNLAVNARDAMPRGGQLAIEVDEVHVTDPRGEGLEELVAGPYVELTVRDTGTGMDAETLAHLFEPFFTTKERGRGTGLGLATVHGIVERSGGAIRVQSSPGAGTSFRILLPRVEPRGEVAVALESSAPLVGGTGTVLLVEDEAAVRRLVRAVLAQAGYTVLEAGDPQAALQLFPAHAEEIDLLLTDLIMPHMSGRELAELLREQRPDLRILFMSGYADDVLDGGGLDVPGCTFLQKPCTLDELLSRVREALAG